MANHGLHQANRHLDHIIKAIHSGAFKIVSLTSSVDKIKSQINWFIGNAWLACFVGLGLVGSLTMVVLAWFVALIYRILLIL